MTGVKMEEMNIKKMGSLVYDYVLAAAYNVHGDELTKLERELIQKQAEMRGMKVISFDTRSVQVNDKLVSIDIHKDIAYYKVKRVAKTHVDLEAYSADGKRLAYFDRVMNYCTSDDSNNSYEYFALVASRD
jgi:hypothetical protein